MSIASSAIASTAIAGSLPVMVGVNGDCVETLAISDSRTASAVVVVTQSEAVSAGDNQSASHSTAGTIAENVSANETISAFFSSVAAISEANAASESQSANSAFSASAAETAVLSEAQSAVLSSAGAMAETLVALDSASSQLSSSGEINEGVLVDTVQDGSFAALILADIVEGAAVNDTQDALTLVDAAIAETAAVSDAAQVFMDLVIYIPRCPIVTADITTRAQANITTQVKAECC